MAQVADNEVGSTVRAKLNNTGLRKNNFGAVAAPIASNDITEGYEVGSAWEHGGDFYICTDNTTDVAVWRPAYIAAALGDPGADRIFFRDHSAGIMDWLIVGGALLITDKTLSVSFTSVELAYINSLSVGMASVALTDGATITPNFAAGRCFNVTLAGNRTLANPTNQVAGQSGTIEIVQDGTGTRTLAYGTNWKFPGGAPTLSTAIGAIDELVYEVRVAGTRIVASLLKDVKS